MRADQIRRTSGALAGDGGDTGGLSGFALSPDAVSRNDAVGVGTEDAPDACALVRSTPGLATREISPSGQQLPQAAARCVVGNDLSPADAAGAGAAEEAWCAWPEVAT